VPSPTALYETLLEAAHIHPYKGAESNNVRNGILLRTDLHTLFDLGLLAIDTESWRVLISQGLAGSNYEQFARRRLRRPRDRVQHPSAQALKQRRTEAGL
jgi:putative restriction endonuclease